MHDALHSQMYNAREPVHARATCAHRAHTMEEVIIAHRPDDHLLTSASYLRASTPRLDVTRADTDLHYTFRTS
jgi:hypothetical protein